MTGGSSAKKASCDRIIAWFAHHIRWVLITALGVPVEPEVKRNLAMLSGPTPAWAASAAPVALQASNASNKLVRRLGTGLRVTMTSTSAATVASMARA